MAGLVSPSRRSPFIRHPVGAVREPPCFADGERGLRRSQTGCRFYPPVKGLLKNPEKGVRGFCR